ncbi:SOS response-associated peptidase [Microbacterium sp. NPDC076895]|uniref:SOS response-associated peptidase n=1 Tax=Microbacterium sp. NPDC076895 TaxID=3154957 RepID=UPI003447562F
MCGRYVTPRLEGIEPLFEVDVIGEDLPEQNWNTKPTNLVPVVVQTEKDGRRLEAARWSLIPTWAKEPPKYPTFNARAEEAAGKATWKASVKSKRCLVPAQGYYEWLTEGKVKTPFFISDPEAQMLAFAGLYSWWRASEADPWLLTTTILTRAAVGGVARIHDRTPVTLPGSAWAEWLDPQTAGDQSLLDWAVAEATPVAERLDAYEVAPLRGDGPELTLPV